MQVFALVEEVLSAPPLPFDPERQTLKGWITYCLRDRGFKIVSVPNADLAVEMRTGEKVPFRITESAENLDRQIAWFVCNRATNQVTLVTPQG
ncbi:hypothetical protein [Pantanalinema sp. GBBB05]|uniref:hypothetical protein n=1 Tax=Pantanalinema sp. GBBB05 TaxID=2604139 RepID=UPI001DF9C923|nr:hypothetical protein [Pantanalinema sp. GBBB05]